MNKLFKNVIALFIMAIAAVMIVPNVFAQISDTDKGSIKISGIKEDGTTINLFKVIDVHFDTAADKQQPIEPVYTWNSSVASWVAANYADYIDTDNNNAVTEKFNSSKSNKEEIANFYKALEAQIKDTTPTKTVTGTKGTNTISDVEMGGYLISIPKKGDYTYNPSAANVYPKYKDATDKWVIQNGEAVAKASTQQVDKKVEGGDNYQTFIGKKINFTADVDVPNYPSDQEHKELKISDTFSEGLTYNKDIKVYGVYNGTQTELTVGTNYTITSSNSGFEITIDNTQYETLVDANGHKYEELHLVYSGKLNENAAITTGNINDIKYDYDNNQKHSEDHVTVYTYGVKIHKFKKENNQYDILPGAVFKLTDKTGKTVTAGSVLKFTQAKDANGNNIEGVYYFDPNGSDEITVPASGKLELRGLAEGTYTLEETKAPESYVKLQQTLDIVIKDGVTETVDGVEVTTLDGKVNDDLNTSFTNKKDYNANDGLADQDVVNTQGFELPVTGGIGTLLFSVLGIVFMGIAAFLVKSIFNGKKVENN